MNNKNYSKQFADNLLAMRTYKKLTKSQVAEKLGMH